MARVIESHSWREIPTIIADTRDDDLLAVDRQTVVTLFKTHGAILFRSFPVGIERFRAFVKSYSETQISYPGSEREPVSPDGKVQTVAVTASALLLHSELSHSPFRPDICWFYCVVAPANGSETLLCDGALVAAELPTAVVGLFEKTALRYRRAVSMAFFERLLGIKDIAALRDFLAANSYDTYYTIDGKEIRQDFIAPMLHEGKFLKNRVFANNIIHNYLPGRPLLYPTFADGSIIPEQLITTTRDIARGYTLELHWRDGDLLMFDNTRFMHGRNAVTDPKRTIWTQFSDAALSSD